MITITPTTPLPRLRERQQQVLDWIVAYINSNGQAPTYREIAQGTFCSTPSALYQVRGLIRAGYLRQRHNHPNVHRNFTFSPQFRAVLQAR